MKLLITKFFSFVFADAEYYTTSTNHTIPFEIYTFAFKFKIMEKNRLLVQALIVLKTGFFVVLKTSPETVYRLRTTYYASVK